MAKQFRVVSLAAAVKGKSAQDAATGLAKLGVSPTQAQTMLHKPVAIKQGLDKSRALVYLDKFTAAGLAVKIEAYEVEQPAHINQVQQQADDVFKYLNSVFEKPVAANTISRKYRRSFALAAAASLVAPLIYFSVIGVVAWCLIWYFTTGTHLLLDGWHAHGGREMFAKAMFGYVMPGFVGGILLLFLLYPFWPGGGVWRSYILERKKNQTFYRLVEKMAQSMGVPAPLHIELITDVNAAAGSANGIVSLIKGELVLKVGLGLVAGVNVQQLMGIIAHEFGHFSQRNSMLAYYWINRVSRWLAMSADGDNIWLRRVQQWQEDVDHYLLLWILMVTAWMMRAIQFMFRHLHDLNLRLTRPMSQQMEFDADLYEARVVGSDHFRESTMALRRMSLAWRVTQDINFHSLNTRDKICRNIPAAAVEMSQRFTPELQRQLLEDVNTESTEYWHTHPADFARIENAERANEPGILQCDLPAAMLLDSFDKLCENSTLGWYYQWGITGAREFMVSNEEVLDGYNVVDKSKPEQQEEQQGIDVSVSGPNQAPAQAASIVNADGMIDWPGNK